MSTVSVELRVFPGMEMKAVDMATALDAATIYSGIVQGCEITYNRQTQLLSMAAGRIMIKGRLGVVTAGDLDSYPTLSSPTTCTLAAVCNLQAQTPFYIRFFTNDEMSALSNLAEQFPDFNANNGIAWIELGTGTIDPATGKVTSWTPNATGSATSTDLVLYQRLQQTVINNQTSINHLLDAWVAYLRKRLFSASYFITEEALTVPAVKVPAYSKKAINFPAIRGTIIRATAINNWTMTPGTIPSYSPTYDSNGIPQQADTATGRYVAKAFCGIRISDSAYVPSGSSQACGKNSAYCALAGFFLTGSEAQRKAYIYIKNVTANEAIVDVAVNLMFVRRG